ncbi:MAG: hypothetical protein Q8O89_05880 [Nanoarchaeota archaeon]|nr:hypothetical protein [Nanoarchaeota archaeon]
MASTDTGETSSAGQSKLEFIVSTDDSNRIVSVKIPSGDKDISLKIGTLYSEKQMNALQGIIELDSENTSFVTYNLIVQEESLTFRLYFARANSGLFNLVKNYSLRAIEHMDDQIIETKNKPVMLNLSNKRHLKLIPGGVYTQKRLKHYFDKVGEDGITVYLQPKKSDGNTYSFMRIEREHAHNAYQFISIEPLNDKILQ